MILCIHIPKTAGSSLREIMNKRVAPVHKISYDYSTHRLTDMKLQELRGNPSELYDYVKNQNINIIYGHYYSSKWIDYFPDSTLLTWVRNPVDRLISDWYHHRRQNIQYYNSELFGKIYHGEISFEEAIELDYMRNVISKHFGLLDVEDFDFIGVVERFEKDISKFLAFFKGVSTDSINVQVNINFSKKVGTPYNISKHIRKKIEDLNYKDMEIYNKILEKKI